MIASAAMIGAVSAVKAKVGITPANVHVYPGDVFEITVDIKDVVGLSAWEVRLSVDPVSLKLLPPVTEGPFLEGAGSTYFKSFFSIVGDYVQVGCMLLEPVTASGDGTLMSMNIQAIGAGPGKITLDAKLLDINLNLLDHTEGDCQVGVRALGEVTGRWEEAQRFSISAEEDEFNTLYANVANLISTTSPCDIYDIYACAVFVGYDLAGNKIELKSPKVVLGRGEETVLSADFDAVEYGEGKYYFNAYCEFAYALEGPFYRGRMVKTLSFVILP